MLTKPLSAKVKVTIAALLVILLAVLTVFYNPVLKKLQKFGIIKGEATGNYIKFLDVGEAESILLVSNGSVCLVDTGDKADSGNYLVSRLKELNIRQIDRLIITHPHSDHAGGMYAVISDFPVKELYYTSLFPDNEETKVYFERVRELCNKKKIQKHILKNDMRIKSGSFDLKVLQSGVIYPDDENRINDACAVIMAKYGQNSFLLTGDIGTLGEKKLLLSRTGGELACRVFKAAHHGSEDSSCEELICAAKPEYAVISCGMDNIYGHPAQEVLKRFSQNGVKVLRTDTDGEITFNFISKNRMKITTKNGPL